MSDPDEPGYDLVMPFLPVVSNGGPYDDDAYVAGFEMGLLSLALESRCLAEHEITIRAGNAAQADLLAMRHGYRCEVEEYGDHPEWVHARFERNPEADQFDAK